MSQRSSSSASDLFTPRRRTAGGVSGKVKPYPRRPFPKIAALLIDAETRTIRTVYVRATRSGLREIFGNQRVTHVDRDYFRAYGTSQHHEEVTNRAILPGARLSVQGKILITGPRFTEIIGEVSQEIMQKTVFACCDAHEPQRLKSGYSSGNISK